MAMSIKKIPCLNILSSTLNRSFQVCFLLSRFIPFHFSHCLGIQQLISNTEELFSKFDGMNTIDYSSPRLADPSSSPFLFRFYHCVNFHVNRKSEVTYFDSPRSLVSPLSLASIYFILSFSIPFLIL